MRGKDIYKEGSQRWAAGMHAAEGYTRARQAAQRERMVHNRANPPQEYCGIKDCDRHAYKGSLCRKHYALVPLSERVALSLDVMDAQLRAAKRGHAKQLRVVRDLLRAA